MAFAPPLPHTTPFSLKSSKFAVICWIRSAYCGDVWSESLSSVRTSINLWEPGGKCGAFTDRRFDQSIPANHRWAFNSSAPLRPNLNKIPEDYEEFESASQSVSRCISQSVSKSVSQSVSQSMYESVTHSVSQSVIVSVSQYNSQCIGQTARRIAYRSTTSIFVT